MSRASVKILYLILVYFYFISGIVLNGLGTWQTILHKFRNSAISTIDTGKLVDDLK